MNRVKKEIFNPNPLSKMIVLIILGVTILTPVNNHNLYTYSNNDVINFFIVIVFLILYGLNGYLKEGIKTLIYFLIIINISKIIKTDSENYILYMFYMVILVAKMFFIPFTAGKFIVKTTDVGSLISAMDKVKVPLAISIPIAVIFRFFPSFKEEKNNIKLAMKIRGVTPRNPIKYLEYVAIPIVMISINIADDISKSAETKCITDPCKKVRYKDISFRVIDLLFLTSIILIEIGGRI